MYSVVLSVLTAINKAVHVNEVSGNVIVMYGGVGYAHGCLSLMTRGHIKRGEKIFGLDILLY